ncbi:agmatinase family protein [Aneurinibacillus migulanus]|jgi:agmatinase|uniref:Formiminoglutamase n=1 Tax=Aneurinibacillus migulanus TaxID=47500 RepID=A0A0D1VIY2_ANEMI|nr:agmatinase family protein [Aneurinibacillus migulanus]KIV59439.1 formiminoglutamase [Aneurinibacillus migulanus]KON97199.1 formiminoglutamase [Aneurinibacillus migulanus]MED0894352.1 agmatinase family protein [Aneurinibacillus migulanus]MED1616436.1 agmatinase family protein [Aneurinibacillus migulanus]SDK20343.1 formiminoglutamase [Aneurinibacillus migulanus]
MNNQKFGIVGFPWDGGASLGRPGARFAPKAIREAFSWFSNRIDDNKVYDVEKRKTFSLLENGIEDFGDINIAAYSTEKTFENAENKIKGLVGENIFPFVLGGDHSVSYPIIKALHDCAEGNIGIIQFDAHLDLVDDSPIQGKFSQSSQMRRALELPGVKPEHIVQIGVRSYNYPWYEAYLKESGIVQITAREVHQSTPQAVVEQALTALQGVDKIYLTFDIDVLDPAYAPGAGANEPGGLTPVQCMSMLEQLYTVVDVFDIAEVNPLYDHHDVTTAFAARIMFDCAVARLSQ